MQVTASAEASHRSSATARFGVSAAYLLNEADIAARGRDSASRAPLGGFISLEVTMIFDEKKCERFYPTLISNMTNGTHLMVIGGASLKPDGETQPNEVGNTKRARWRG